MSKPVELSKSDELTVQAVTKADKLESSLTLSTFAQVVIAVVAVIGAVYLLKLVLVTTLVAILLAYILEPFVRSSVKIGIPRGVGCVAAVLLSLALAGGVAYFSYNRGVEFSEQLPEYITKVRQALGKLPQKAAQIEEQGRAAVQGGNAQSALPVRVEGTSGLGQIISETGGTILEALLAVGFLPFLVYFMLRWKDHFQRATVLLFPKEHRVNAYRTVGDISEMIRSYIAGNVLMGLISAAIFTATFGFLGLEYFYFLGLISGFVSLVPYLGLFLALLPPIAAGLGMISGTGLIVIVAVVAGVHMLAVNVLYPAFVGRRLSLNPVVVSLALLFWSWIWGALGLILAIPILGAAKIICDHMPPLHGLATWLGESDAPGSR